MGVYIVYVSEPSVGQHKWIMWGDHKYELIVQDATSSKKAAEVVRDKLPDLDPKLLEQTLVEFPRMENSKGYDLTVLSVDDDGSGVVRILRDSSEWPLHNPTQLKLSKA